MRRASFFMLSLLATLVSPRTSASPQPAATGPYAEIFDAFTRTVSEKFYDPHFRGVDWGRLSARVRPRAIAARDDAQFHRISTELLAQLGVSHLELKRPSGTAQASVPLRLVSQNGRRYVAEVPFLSDAYRRGVRPGDELLSSDAELEGALGSIARLRFLRCSGAKVNVAVRREYGFWPPEAPSVRWRSIETGPGVRIGYIRADRFDDGSDALADSAMAALGDSVAIIIDLRGNSGGNASGVRLASYFTGRRTLAFGLLMRPYLEALGRPVTPADILEAPAASPQPYTTDAVFAALSANRGGIGIYTEDLGERAYRGRVVVLMGPETASAAEGFAWLMRQRTQATLVGRPTAGLLLSSEKVTLPGGWSLVLPVAGVWGPDGQDVGDRPVPPHVEVPWSRAAACSGTDLDLARAFELIESRPGR
jgi:carboxyl-terminal processing protease